MTDTNVTQLVINELTKAQYDQVQKQSNQLYLVTDEIPLDSSDISTTLSSSSTNSQVAGAKAVVDYIASNPQSFLTSITGLMVTTALGYTPYNATNPNGYITGITGSMVTTALGYTPYNSTNPSSYQTDSQVTTTVSNHNTSQVAHQDIRNSIITNLSGLSDVDVSGVATDQFLKWNGTKWVPSTSSASVSWGGIGGTLSNQTDLQTALDGKLSSSTKYGADLSYSNSQLQLKDQDGNALGSAVTITTSASLSGLTDVSLSSPASGQFLTYNGSNWVNTTFNGLQNTATGAGSLTILGTSTAESNSINIGTASSASGSYSTVFGAYATAALSATAIGQNSSASNYGIALGNGAEATANYAIQIGNGTNSTASTFSVALDSNNNYQLLDSNGYIPLDRINSTANKTAIVGWGNPDYSAGVALVKDGTNKTITQNGFVFFRHTSIVASSNAYVNDILVFHADAYNSAYSDAQSLMMQVSTGDTVKGTSTLAEMIFYPAKGS